MGYTTVKTIRVDNATTVFGQVQPVGTGVFDEATEKEYRLTDSAGVSDTITTLIAAGKIQEVERQNEFRGYVDSTDAVPANLQNGDWVRCKTVGTNTYTAFSGVSADFGNRLEYSAETATWLKYDDSFSGVAALAEDLDANNNKIIHLTPATATGDAVEYAQLLDKTTDFEVGLNKFNYLDSGIELNKYITTSTGNIGTASGWAISGYCLVSELTAYILSNMPLSVQNTAIRYYDIDKTYLSFENLTSLLFTTPANCVYVRFTIKDAVSDDYSLIQLEEGTTATAFEEFYYINSKESSAIMPSSLIKVDIKEEGANPESILKRETIENLITSGVKPVVSAMDIVDFPFIEPFKKILSNNLWDKANQYVTGEYINDGTGLPNTYANSTRTTMIPVNEGDLIYCAGYGNYFKIHVYTVYEDYTTRISLLTQTAVTGGKMAIVPSGANFVAFNLTFNNVATVEDTFQFNKGKLFAYDSFLGKANIDNDEVFISKELEVNIKNSDKITVFGNSYTQGYTLLGKHYLSFLSMFSDYQFRNFGKSGDDLLEIMTRIRTDSTWFGTIPISEFGSTYGIIACRDNNLDLTTGNVESYYEHAKKLAKEIETLGAKVILSTEHQKMATQLFSAFSRLENEYGYMFMNWGKFARNSFSNDYFSPFWYNSHPSTRTQALWSENMRLWLDTLPKPKQGIKIFRKRTDVTVSDIDSDLMFETIIQRAKLFNEIYVGHTKLTSAAEKYFDRQDNAGIAYESQNDEYMTMQAGSAISIPDYALIETVIPCTEKHLDSFKLFLDCTNVSKVYVKKTLGLASYPAYPTAPSDPSDPYWLIFENPLGEWKEITENSDGYYEFVKADYTRIINYDKISFLVESNGSAMALSNVYYKWVGEPIKDNSTEKRLQIATGTELLANNLFPTGWTAIGSPATYTPVVNPADAGETELLPSGITTVKEITDSAYYEQALIDSASNWRDYKIQIRILCRYFPEFITTDLAWDTSTIKGDSYDLADLIVQIQNSASDAIKVGEKPVNLYWHELIFEGILTSETSNKIIIKSADAKAIQIAYVYVKLFK